MKKLFKNGFWKTLGSILFCIPILIAPLFSIAQTPVEIRKQPIQVFGFATNGQGQLYVIPLGVITNAILGGSVGITNWPTQFGATNGSNPFTVQPGNNSNSVAWFVKMDLPQGAANNSLQTAGNNILSSILSQLQSGTNNFTGTVFQGSAPWWFTGGVTQVGSPWIFTGGVSQISGPWSFTGGVTQSGAPWAFTGAVSQSGAPWWSTGLVYQANAPWAFTGGVSQVGGPWATTGTVYQGSAPWWFTGAVSQANSPWTFTLPTNAAIESGGNLSNITNNQQTIIALLRNLTNYESACSNKFTWNPSTLTSNQVASVAITLSWLMAINTNSFPVQLSFFDSTSAGRLGTPPDFTIPIPGNTGGAGFVLPMLKGTRWNNGLQLVVTASNTTNTAPGGAIWVNGCYGF